MRAYEINGSFGLDRLQQVERTPVLALAPNQVRVRMHAASLNYRDLLTVQGLYNPKQALPLVPCSDGAGEVVELGAESMRFKVGDRVTPTFAQKWLSGAPHVSKIRSTLGGPLDGVLCEEGVFHEDGLVHIPAHLSYEEAATLPCAALTAWSALEQMHFTSGQTLLVQGTGGVSLFALQFAKMRGGRVIVTSKSDEKLARAKALGADEAINYVQTPEWAKAARKLTGGEGVCGVVEVGGGGTFNQSVNAVKPGGTVALIGVLSGVATQASLTPILMQNLRIQGVLVGHREQFEAMNKAIASAQLRPIIGETHAFNEAKQAFLHMKDGAHFGKIVIRVA
jgi:NADPH:quinone reductase-like Zn-dependent oxidoreductase